MRIHRDLLDTATEDKPLCGEYQSTKGSAWQLSARVMPHFLSSCIIHTFVNLRSRNERVSVIYLFIVCIVVGCIAACLHAAITASGVAGSWTTAERIAAVGGWSSAAWRICLR